jgi:dienelactone hydrolase
MREIAGEAAQAGAFILTPDSGPGDCAVLLLGGSEGGDQMARTLGPHLVDADFTVLGVPYHRPGGGDRSGIFASLPRAFANLPVERVGQAADWLSSKTSIPRDRMGIYGFSKGAELALLAASLDGPYAAVVAIAPSDVVWEGWGPGLAPGTASSFSWKGSPLPFVPYEGFAREMARYARGEREARLANAHEQGLEAHPQRAALARIEVELCRCPILLAAGGRDGAWPSASMAAAIAERREDAGLATELLIFPDCGHVLCGRGDWRNPNSPTGVQDQSARSEIWARSLAFLAAHLRVAERPR